MLKNCCYYSTIIITILIACIFVMYYLNKENKTEQEPQKLLMIW